MITVIAASQMKRGRWTACHTARYPSSTSTIVSMYIRVSVEYRIAYGEAATTSNALHADPARSVPVSPAEPLPGQVGERQHDHAEHARERPHREVAGPEDLDPEMQQQVVERRRAVPLQRLLETRQRHLGDVDGEGLVEPEIGCREEAQDDRDGQDAGDERAR